MSEEMGQVVLRMFPTAGEPFPVLLSPGQATRLGRDLQDPKFLPKPTVQWLLGALTWRYRKLAPVAIALPLLARSQEWPWRTPVCGRGRDVSRPKSRHQIPMYWAVIRAKPVDRRLLTTLSLCSTP